MNWLFEAPFADRADAMLGRPAGRLFGTIIHHLRQQGFIPSKHFLERFLERAKQQGVRFDPRTFAQDFRNAKHYRQTRAGYNTRIAMIRGIPIVYRPTGQNANRTALITLLPEGAKPPVARINPPRLREADLMDPTCPKCGQLFKTKGREYYCTNCKKTYPNTSGKPLRRVHPHGNNHDKHTKSHSSRTGQKKQLDRRRREFEYEQSAFEY